MRPGDQPADAHLRPRAARGSGAGSMLGKAQAILFQTFSKEEQGAAQAAFGLAVIVGPAIGPTLGGYLTDALDWRWIFFINIPVGMVAVLLAVTFMPRDETAHRAVGYSAAAGGLARHFPHDRGPGEPPGHP